MSTIFTVDGGYQALLFLISRFFEAHVDPQGLFFCVTRPIAVSLSEPCR